MLRLLTLFFFTLLFVSCEKDTSTEYEEGRNRILGTWQFIERTEVEDVGQNNGILLDKTGTITFNSDGTGSKNLSFFGENNFEWIYQLSPEKISVTTKLDTSSQGFTVFGESLLFTIQENRIDLQQWNANDNTIFLIDSMTQLASREITWEMTR